MDLTPEDLRTLRDIIVRAVSEGHEVLANAARRPGTGAREQPSLASRPHSPSVQEHTAKLAYSIKDACAALGLSRSTLYNLIDAGELRALKVAGRRLIPTASIEAMLSRAETNSA